MTEKKVLYISNIEVPYRVRFFNELARYCDLTVLYEREQSSNRDKTWTASEECRYRRVFLGGLKIRGEDGFSFKILRHIRSDYDVIVVGCYNSPVQMLAILAMRLLRIRYFLNLDGEVFLNGGLKSKIKAFFLRGAAGYLTAGEKAAASVATIAEGRPVMPYYFSSLLKEEVEYNSTVCTQREQFFLVVGQYFPYKGMDVALEAARKDPSVQYKFVGMGNRTQLFMDEQRASELENVEIIPFLQKKDLEREYQNCTAMVLPTRQECWGLVVNEAASFGTPIVSTWGSGAAVEFVGDTYPQYLAVPGDAESLLRCIYTLLQENDTEAYSSMLKEKSEKYNIENSVEVHLRVFGIR